MRLRASVGLEKASSEQLAVRKNTACEFDSSELCVRHSIFLHCDLLFRKRCGSIGRLV